MKLLRVLLAVVMLLALSSQALVVFAVPSPGMPGLIYGDVIYNGSGVGGVTVTLSGAESKSTTTDGNGYYQFGVTQGNTYTVSASYDGHTASKTVTINTDQVNINLDVTGSQSSGGSSGGTFTYYNPPTATPTVAQAATPTPTPTPTPMPTSTPTPIPSPSPTPQAASNSLPWWLILVALGVIVVAAAGYLLLRKQ